MIKNLVFDIGNVLISFNPEEYIDSFGFEPLLRDKLFKLIFKSEHWINLDRGTITEEAAVGYFSREAPETKAFIESVMKGWKDILLPIPETIELLKELKSRGYKIFVLSNYHRAAFEKAYSENEFFSLLDGKVISYEVKYVKPEKEIYKHLLETYDLKPEETLFIDDMDINIKGAQLVGINTVLFEGAEKLRSYLKESDLL